MAVGDFTLSGVSCLDCARIALPISTGVGFLDHMIDQLNSHAQVGVSVTVARRGDDLAANGDIGHAFDVANRHADEDQGEIAGLVGAALGRGIAGFASPPGGGRSSRFCCPLDEALVECVLTRKAQNGNNEGRLLKFTLPPYGKYPTGRGRTKIGAMKTQYFETFFSELAKSSGINISLVKIRGDNGHHVIESAFKAFSRALRNLLDGTNTNEYASAEHGRMWGPRSESHASGLELRREGRAERLTKETSISVHVRLNGLPEGPDGYIEVDTGIKTMDEFVSILAEEAAMSIEAKCKGDLFVDDHHTSEDVAIALGQVLTSALGTKAGLNRMWCAVGAYGDAEVEATMDLSNRPCLTHNLSLSSNPNGEEYAGDLSVEMLDHVLESLVVNSRSTVHIVERRPGRTVVETAMATAMALGRALRICAAVDPRRAGRTASSKGTLSA